MLQDTYSNVHLFRDSTADLFRWSMISLSLPLCSMLRCLPDEFLLRSSLLKDSTVRVFLGEAPASFPADLPHLESLCQQAPFGKGSETVIDTDVRRVLETDRCRVDFPLEEVLGEIARYFSLPPTISAQFYKLLYYRTGDFFLEHIDRYRVDQENSNSILSLYSFFLGFLLALVLLRVFTSSSNGLTYTSFHSKKSPCHTLTLALDVGSDCAGGELVFPITAIREDDNQSSPSPSPSIEWKSSGVGSWACWFAPQPHSVRPLTSGYRLIAVYNIDVPDVPFSPSPTGATLFPMNQSSASPLRNLPGDVLRVIVSYVASNSLADVNRLARTCKALSHLARSQSWLIGLWIANRTNTIYEVRIAETCLYRSLPFFSSLNPLLTLFTDGHILRLLLNRIRSSTQILLRWLSNDSSLSLTRKRSNTRRSASALWTRIASCLSVLCAARSEGERQSASRVQSGSCNHPRGTLWDRF